MKNTTLTPRILIDTLGRKTVAKAVGVKTVTVSAAYVKNELPSAWYFAVKQLAKQKGINVLEEWFSFKRPPAE